jgi:CheY-like chemotaxis protein
MPPPAAPRILVVDDDELVTRVAVAALRREGFEVVVHDSGFGLAGVVREHRPAAIVVDISMPGLSGDSATESLREVAERWRIELGPIVVYSGLESEELARRAAAMHADAVVPKASGPIELASCLRRLLPRGE